jgi:hypothetical protein
MMHVRQSQSREENSLVAPTDEGSFTIVPALIADVGATSVRFALVGAEKGFQRVRVLACEDYATIQDAIWFYLEHELQLTNLRRVEAAALAVAGPVTDDQVTLTNHPWSFSISQLHRHLAIDRLHVVNDFTAVAIARHISSPTSVPRSVAAWHWPPRRSEFSALVPASGSAGWFQRPADGSPFWRRRAYHDGTSECSGKRRT